MCRLLLTQETRPNSCSFVAAHAVGTTVLNKQNPEHPGGSGQRPAASLAKLVLVPSCSVPLLPGGPVELKTLFSSAVAAAGTP